MRERIVRHVEDKRLSSVFANASRSWPFLVLGGFYSCLYKSLVTEEGWGSCHEGPRNFEILRLERTQGSVSNDEWTKRYGGSLHRRVCQHSLYISPPRHSLRRSIISTYSFTGQYMFPNLLPMSLNSLSITTELGRVSTIG